VFDDEETDWLYGLRPRPIMPPAVPDADMADTDRQRQAGTAQLETDMAGLSARADEVDAAWSAYREHCRLAVRAAAPRDRAPGSRAHGRARRRGAQHARRAWRSRPHRPIKDGMCAAEGRRGGPPSIGHDASCARYHLEWDGWDRVCP
jgi:hypothetical protein